jgi:hypothetical protein
VAFPVCCFCDEPIEDELVAELVVGWNDTYDCEERKAHVQCLQRALHRDHREFGSRSPTGRSFWGHYLEQGVGAEWLEIALTAGFQEVDDYPVEGMPGDLVDLEDVLKLVGRPERDELDQLLAQARSWAPAALSLLVQEARQRGAIIAAIVPDIVAIVVLLARPIEVDTLKGQTEFADELAESIAAVAQVRHTNA